MTLNPFSPAGLRLGTSLIALNLGGGLILSSLPAAAADVSIETKQTTAVATATASSGSPANVTITSAGSVEVTSGTAVTVNSNDKLANDGVIATDGDDDTTAVLIDGTGGISTIFKNTGTIKVTGTEGGGNAGILVSGGTVTGSITTDRTALVSVAGEDSVGLEIRSRLAGDAAVNSVSVTGKRSEAVSVTGTLDGDLFLTGSSAATGANSTGILVTGTVGGTVTNGGTLSVGAAAATASDGTAIAEAPASAGIRISGNVGGGVVNDKYYIDKNGNVVPTADVDTSKDTLVTGSILTYGGAPAIVVTPDADTPTDVTVGVVGAGTDAYGIINRGNVKSASAVVGTAATGIRVAGRTSGGTDYHAIVDGGVANTGTVAASALDADATGIEIGTLGQANEIFNSGTVAVGTSATAASGSTAAGPGGDATGILIDVGATTTTIRNTGTVDVRANGEDMTGTAILDKGNVVATIANTGTLSALSSDGDAVAIDVSASTRDVSVTNSGKIIGSVLFGAGNDSFASSGSTLSNDIDFGAGQNQFALSGTAIFNGTLTTSGSLGVAISGTSTLVLQEDAPHLSSLTADGKSTLAVTLSDPDAPLLTVDGTASFTDQSKIKLRIATLVDDATVTVVQADGGLTTDHATSLLDVTGVPFLYAYESTQVTGNAVQLELRRKSATELGFVPGIAGIYDASVEVMRDDAAVLDAIGNLSRQGEMLAAYRQFLPPSFGSATIQMAKAMQSAGATMTAQRMNAIGEGNWGDTDNTGLWGQESGNFGKQKDSQGNPGYSAELIGITVGFDRRLGKAGAIGGALTLAWNNVDIDGMYGHPLSVTSQQLDLYASQTFGIFYAQAVASFAHSHYNSERQINFGSISAQQTASWNGYQFAGSLTAGAKLKFGGFTLQPSNSLTYLSLHQGGYDLTGASGLDLSVKGQTKAYGENTAQIAAMYDLPLGKAKLRVEGRAAYVSALGSKSVSTTAQFIAAGDSFELFAKDLAGHATKFGGKLAYIGKEVTFSVDYDRLKSAGYRSHAIVGTVRLQF